VKWLTTLFLGFLSLSLFGCLPTVASEPPCSVTSYFGDSKVTNTYKFKCGTPDNEIVDSDTTYFE
jgi:hypothetical protein